MIVEMHCHTSEYSSCSMVPAADMIKKAYLMGIQAIVLTDHHYQWGELELKALREKAGVPEIFKIFSGQEVTTTNYGDLLVYGGKRSYEKQKYTLEDIREDNPDAAIIWAHPYRNGKVPSPEKLLNPLLDGVEIFNSNLTILEASHALKDWHHHKFTATGGTDTHALSYTGSYPTIFDHPLNTIDDLIEELKAGRCRPYYKETQKSGTTNTKVTEVTIGPKGGEERKKIIIKSFEDIDSWKSGERSFYIVRELLQNGFEDGPYRVPKPLDKDKKNLTLIEERIGGKTLYDTLVKADPADAPKYLRRTARWLSKMHNLKLKITPPDEFLEIEPDRTNYYLKSLIESNNKHLKRVQEIRDYVLEKEIDLIKNHPEVLVQAHGDFHPKNIFINKKEPKGYVAVIDFDSSYMLPRAFDVGTFLAQYINMFFNLREIQEYAPVDVFLDTYINNAEDLEDEFISQVNLFRARASLSILYYLAKVNLGDTENFFRIMIEAEKNLVATM